MGNGISRVWLSIIVYSIAIVIITNNLSFDLNNIKVSVNPE